MLETLNFIPKMTQMGLILMLHGYNRSTTTLTSHITQSQMPSDYFTLQYVNQAIMRISENNFV